MTNQQRMAAIRQYLQQALTADYLEVIDDSAAHVGHTSAKGAGHFEVIVVSTEFAGLSPLQRHRQIYQALQPMMPQEIHALSIKAYARHEWDSN